VVDLLLGSTLVLVLSVPSLSVVTAVILLDTLTFRVFLFFGFFHFFYCVELRFFLPSFSPGVSFSQVSPAYL